jgi:hypothetical protein
MTIPPPAARRFLWRFTVVAAIIAMELGAVKLTGHVRGSGTAMHEPHGMIAPAKNSHVHALVGVLSPPAFEPKYRLGFLEFENDPE